VIGVILLVAIAGGAWWAWIFINERLAPLVERNLKQLLGRPVEIGGVERVSLNSLRFDSASIPATSTDPDRLVAEAVEVRFDLWQVLLNRTLLLNVTLIQPDIYLEQAKDGRWIETEIQTQEGGEDLIEIDLQTIRVQNADLVLVPTPEPGRPQGSVAIAQVDGIARLLEQGDRIQFEVSGQPTRGGKVAISGETRPDIGQTELVIQGQNVLATDVRRLVDLPIDPFGGRADANLIVQLQPDREQPIILGQASLDNVTVQIENLPQAFSNTQGRLLFQAGQNIALENISTRYGRIPVRVEGVINTLKGYNLSGNVRAVSVKNVLDTLNVDLPFPTAGTVRADLRLQGAIARPILTGTVSTIQTATVDRVEFSNIRSRFRLTPEQLIFANIQGTPTVGGQVTGSGRLNLEGQNELVLNFQARNVPGNAIAREYGTSPAFTIGNVSGRAQIAGTPGNIQTLAQLRAPEATYPGTAKVVITNEGTTLIRDAIFQVAGGRVTGNGQIVDGQFQAVVNASGVALNQFSQDLRGQFSAALRLEGTSFDPSDMRAQGRVGFSQGLAIIERPITAQVRWNGERIIVDNATAPGFNANGTVAVRLQGAEAPQIVGFNLNVRAEDYNLPDLGLNLPGNTVLAGAADFTGQVTGSPDAPNAVGAIRLQNLRVNDLAFEPLLTGRLNYQAGQRTELQVAGRQDRIAFVLDPENRPTQFFVRRDEAVAVGRTEDENLIVNLEDFPIAVLRNAIPGDVLQNIGPIAGDISGNLAIDLAEDIGESTVVADIAIARPRVGRIAADAFRGRIRYEDGDLTLREAQLQRGESRIALTGDLQAGQGFQFQINLDRARIENVLQTLGLFDYQDIVTGLEPTELAGAEILQNLSVGLPNAPVLDRLRLFSEIQALLARQRQRRQEPTIPALAELNGIINGKITVSGSLQPGLQPAFNVSFDLLGQDWLWGEYTIDEVVAQGTYDNGALTLQPLRVDLGKALVAFTGQLGQEQLSGQVRVEELPVALIEPFLPELPVQVAGRLNALATLAGSLENPSATGEIALVEGSVNNRSIESAQLDFNYNNARLNFDSTVLVAQTQQPVAITGSIPLALPFASVEPDSDRISLQANVRNEGLALLNLFTDAVAWVNGQGQVNVAVEGTLNQPIVRGTASVENATFKAQALPQPLTNVTGTVQFNDDRIVVEGIQARFNGEPLTAEGVLPIFATQAAQQLAATNPLTVSLEDLNVNLEGLYQGGVSGNVVITGTVLSPDIGGKIILRNGQIAIAGRGDEETPAPATNLEAIESLAVGDTTPTSGSPIEFANLRLILDEDVRVTVQPILDFEVEGDLTIDGTLNNPRPVGTVSLVGGQVNLFTTQFTLDPGYKQTARFTPERGLDPILDIQLVTTVPEVTGGRIAIAPSDPFLSNEIRDVPATGFSSVSTVRVQATARGPASELEENLELTSDPPRSEAEIVALLGGSFVNALSAGQANPAQGLATIAGTTLFNYLQRNFGELSNAVGISEFRLFPTLVTDPDEDVSVLGLAAEAVFDITNNISFSVSTVFAADEPLRYNVIYRVNDQVRVRASTNFAGESRALVEYESRF
jgi:translocation and assembly module TamB